VILVIGIVHWSPIQMGTADLQQRPARYSAADPAWFELSAYRGVLSLRGHTVSQSHESRLRNAAAAGFGEHELRVEFLPLGTAPTWWSDATTKLLAVTATIQSPTARLANGAIRITGVVANPSAANTHLKTLRKILPASALFDIRLTSIETDASVELPCESQLAALKPGPVNFEESSAEFRSSAYPVLERVLSLADACRDSTISITGHTDASGDEAWNKHLSLARANAVAEYLRVRGIDGDRIVVTGAGSSTPIADNATRHGRSQNRRIDINLAPR
jgi:OOP family OmpA-OmpF porin